MAWRPKNVPPEAKIDQIIIANTPETVHVDCTWAWDVPDGGVTTTTRANARWQAPAGTDLGAVLEALKPAGA